MLTIVARFVLFYEIREKMIAKFVKCHQFLERILAAAK